jgi:hypothetical protein
VVPVGGGSSVITFPGSTDDGRLGCQRRPDELSGLFECHFGHRLKGTSRIQIQ